MKKNRTKIMRKITIHHETHPKIKVLCPVIIKLGFDIET